MTSTITSTPVLNVALVLPLCELAELLIGAGVGLGGVAKVVSLGGVM